MSKEKKNWNKKKKELYKYYTSCKYYQTKPLKRSDICCSSVFQVSKSN